MSFAEKRTFPLDGFHARIATDADAHAANLSAWDQMYDQLSSGKFYGNISELWMGRLQLFCEFTSHTVRQSCKPWKGSWWFGIPVQDFRLGRIGSNCIGKDAIAVRSGNTDFELLTPDNFEILGVVIEQNELIEHAHATEHVSLSPSLLNIGLLNIGQNKRDQLQSLFRQILSEVAQSPRLLEHQASRQAIRSSIVQALAEICCMQAHPVHLSTTQVNYHSLVSRIREYILHQSDEPVTIADICRNFYVSRRTLQNAFHSVVGMNPIAYLRAVRLNQVRRMLRDRNSEIACVQDAAASCGFWHLSQFSRDYRKLFGELPSESLRHRLTAKAIH